MLLCLVRDLGYSAYLSQDIINLTFGSDENLFDVASNQVYFQQLLGLAEHTPFECTGEIDEVRLLFMLCYRKGMKGEAMQLFEKEIAASFDAWKAVDKFAMVYTSEVQIPEPLSGHVFEVLNNIATEARHNTLCIIEQKVSFIP